MPNKFFFFFERKNKNRFILFVVAVISLKTNRPDSNLKPNKFELLEKQFDFLFLVPPI